MATSQQETSRRPDDHDSPIVWFGNLVFAHSRGDVHRAAVALEKLERLGWRVRHLHESEMKAVVSNPVESKDVFPDLELLCTACGGSGRYLHGHFDSEPCSLCSGSGYVLTEAGSNVLAMVKRRLSKLISELS